MNASNIEGIPMQYKGAYHDTESRKFFANIELCAESFEVLKKRFFSVNHWRDFCGDMSADFQLFDKKGSYVDRKPIEGDYMRIDIPGPGDFQEKGYDWVRIMKIDEKATQKQLERCLMICRPCVAPRSKTGHIAHFYASASSSSFVIERGKHHVLVGIYGRNEVPNISNAGIFGKIRNFLIYIGGVLRLTKIQWKCLADGFLDF